MFFVFPTIVNFYIAVHKAEKKVLPVIMHPLSTPETEVVFHTRKAARVFDPPPRTKLGLIFILKIPSPFCGHTCSYIRAHSLSPFRHLVFIRVENSLANNGHAHNDAQLSMEKIMLTVEAKERSRERKKHHGEIAEGGYFY